MFRAISNSNIDGHDQEEGDAKDTLGDICQDTDVKTSSSSVQRGDNGDAENDGQSRATNNKLHQVSDRRVLGTETDGHVEEHDQGDDDSWNEAKTPLNKVTKRKDTRVLAMEYGADIGDNQNRQATRDGVRDESDDTSRQSVGRQREDGPREVLLLLAGLIESHSKDASSSTEEEAHSPCTDSRSIKGPGNGLLRDGMTSGQEELCVILPDTLLTASEDECTDTENDNSGYR